MKVESYAVEMRDGLVVFYSARWFIIWRGRLIFWDRLRKVGAVEKGEWIRVLRGLSEDDIE